MITTQTYIEAQRIPEDPDGFTPILSEKDDCEGCYFDPEEYSVPACECCAKYYRPEGRSVIFIKKDKDHGSSPT